MMSRKGFAALQEPIVAYDNVIFSYGGTPVLHDISFRLNKGEVVGMLGPKGAGRP